MVNVVDKDTQMCISLAARPGNHGNRFHNFLYDELGLNYLYKSFSSSDIGATIGGVRSLGIRGVSVSMPYKESCMEFLDAIDPSAGVIGSVNTIVNDAGVLTGYNTDFIAVRSMLDTHEVPREQEFAVLGSGGMAKAVVAALRDAGFERGLVVARNVERARPLAKAYGYEPVTSLGAARPAFLLNATPVGMAGGAESADLPFGEDAIRAADTVFDMVYLPPNTPFVALATSLGKRVLTGAEVMQLQALEQFVLYTGVRPTLEQIERAEAYAWA